MKYSIVIEKRARKFIEKLSISDKERVLKAIYQLPEGDTKPLKGYSQIFRLRVGTYRILYSMDNNRFIIIVIDAGNRGEIYKRY